MNSTRTIKTVAATSVLALLALGAGTASASAKGIETRASGTCSKGSTWKLKAKADNANRIEVQLEVDSNRVGQFWAASLWDGTTKVYGTTRTTAAPSGSFTVTRFIANRAGADRITGQATHAARGEVCRGVLTFTG